MLGEMSVLLDQPHTATVRAAADSAIYEIDDAASFLRQQPAVTLIIARMLAQRLNVANTYLADLKRQYAGHGNHLAMVGDLLQSMMRQLSPPLGDLRVLRLLGCEARPVCDYPGFSPRTSNCRLHSAGASRSRSTPTPRGKRPSTAALTRSGARNASEIVILT